MTRRKALTIAISVAGLSGLIFVALLMSKPVPAISHASYTWQPGCHCGKPATPAKPTTTTAKKVTTTATSGTKAASATAGTTSTAISTSTSTKASTQSSTSISAGNPATSSTIRTKRSTTTTGAQSDGAQGGSDQNGDQNGSLALGAAVASRPGGGDGGSSGGAGDAGGGSPGAGGESVAANSAVPPHYYISPVAIGFLLVYGVSFALYRTKRLRVATHRKVWNVLLLATFLLCGLMGLVLTVGVTRNPPMELPTWLLVWHVEAGIAMCFISCFHVGWHLRYYLALVTGRRRAPRAEQVPAVDRSAARDRAPRPRAAHPVLARTEEDRMLAFQQRQAARAGEARAARPAPTPTEADRRVEDAKRRVAPAT